MSTTRHPAVAGRFYPADEDGCMRMLDRMASTLEVEGLPVGGVFPHAGWIYSGPTAYRALAAIAPAGAETIVLFGAVHVLDANDASLYPAGQWETPLGTLEVDEELADGLAAQEHVSSDASAHQNEHSIEVQLPLIQHALGDVRILPIMVRPGPHAVEIGAACASAAAALGRKTVFLGSTDLTHYGPAFGFETHGRGQEGFRWAKEVNDRRLIDLITALDAKRIVPEAMQNRNACGAGAIAATIGAVREVGANRYIELEHTTSVEREPGGMPSSLNSVGYEAGVFTRQA